MVMSNLVHLQLAKKYLRLGDHSDQYMDELVETLICGAEEWVEKYCSLGFGERIVTDELDGGTKALRPRRRPFRYLINLINRDNPEQPEILGTDYYIVNGDIQRWSLNYGVWYGGTPGGVWGAWTGRLKDQVERWMEGRGRYLLTYSGGYYTDECGSTTTSAPDGYPHWRAPAALKWAVLSLVRRAYDNRGGVASESALGWTVSWKDLQTSDIMETLSPYMRFDA
jgi:hypothetical protein